MGLRIGRKTPILQLPRTIGQLSVMLGGSIRMTKPLEIQSQFEQESLAALTKEFQVNSIPVEVDFRKLMPSTGSPNKNAHSIHPYPAKLLVNIPQYFLAALSPRSGDCVVDCFCGSGTVLYEAAQRSLRTVGSDSNPLARLITKAKLTTIDRDKANAELAQIIAYSANATPNIPDVVNRSYWFSDRISESLGRLRTAIQMCATNRNKALFEVSFSATVRRVSFADPRLSVPVKINPERSARYGAKGDLVLRRLQRLEDVDVIAVYWGIAKQNIRRATPATDGNHGFEPAIFDDARALGLEDKTVDLAITSPPYVGAQKYIRASSLCMGWLGMTPDSKLRPFERLSIGREHLDAHEELSPEGTGIPDADALLGIISERNPLRARIAQRYLLEMKDALNELARTMKKGSNFVLVVGPNLVTGLEFPTPVYLEQLANEAGFTTQLHLIDAIESRGLMTKRNRTAGVIQQESVFLLRRG